MFDWPRRGTEFADGPSNIKQLSPPFISGCRALCVRSMVSFDDFA